jgi:4-hydroxybutyryl-CoA dehydratase/vinylacetyl-CoA-Delta-isomerase
MMTGKQYIESLRNRNIKVYLKGKLLDPKTLSEHPYLAGHFNSAAVTYDLAHDPAAEDLMTTKSHLTGKNQPVHTHPPQRRRLGQKSQDAAHDLS